MNIPTLVAHRGYMAHYPENTLLGLEAALRAGARLLEFDLQMTASGEFVLLHEPSLERTAGRNISMFELSPSELDAVSVHEPRRLGERFASTPLARFDQVLELLARSPGVGGLVEVKGESLEHWGLESVMEQLLELLQPFWNRCTLISRELEALDYARRRGGGPVGLVLHRFDKSHRKQAVDLAPELLICNERKIGEEELLWKGNWRWMLYDITEPEKALSWADRGVELIETRDIGALLKDPRLASKICHHGL